MTSGNKLFDLLRAGKTVLGVTNMYPAAGIIEGMCRGWDFVWIDGQHGEMTYDSVMDAIRVAAAMGVDSVVRVPGHEHGMLGMYADMAPSAIMVPMVNTSGEARDMVAALRFPPLGRRSYGGRRIGDLHGRDYYKERELLVIAQIETAEAVENAREIISTEGVDCLFFGATDLKLDLGLPLNTSELEHERLRAAMIRIAAAARAAGKFAGCVTYAPETFEAARGMGYQMLAGGVDVIFLRTLSAERLAEFRRRL